MPRFRHVTDSFEDIEIIGAFQGSLHGANTMALGDIDEDGDHDLFWGDFFEPGLLFIENTGSCRRPVLRGVPRPFPLRDPVSTSGYNAPALGDIDQDGDMDLTMGVLGGAFNPNLTTVENLHQFEQDADGGFTETTTRLVRSLDVGSESIPAFTDLDGDGDLDLLVSNKIEPGDTRSGRLFVFENTGTPTAPAFTARGAVPGLPEAYHYAPAFGDLDGDGDDDMLLGEWRDRVAYYRNDGGSSGNAGRRGPDDLLPRWTLVDSAAATLTRGRNTTPALGDLDADGDLDLIVGESSGTLNYYRNDGGPGSPDFVLVSDEFQDIDIGRRSVPTILDLDADGDLDLAVGTEASGLLFYLNEGSPREPVFVETVPFAPAVPTFTAPVFVDIDGDGDRDLVAGGVGGGDHGLPQTIGVGWTSETFKPSSTAQRSGTTGCWRTSSAAPRRAPPHRRSRRRPRSRSRSWKPFRCCWREPPRLRTSVASGWSSCRCWNTRRATSSIPSTLFRR